MSQEAEITADLPVNELRAYEDLECLKPLDHIDLGRIPVGQVFEKLFYFKNHSNKWPVVNITLNETDSEVRADYPQLVAPGDVAPVKLVFAPSLSRREPLNVTELFRGELWIG